MCGGGAIDVDVDQDDQDMKEESKVSRPPSRKSRASASRISSKRKSKVSRKSSKVIVDDDEDEI